MAAHTGSSLSMVDILTVIYTASLGIHRDDVFISKGHAAAGLYAVLAEIGLVDEREIAEYCKNGGALGGHVTQHGVQGVNFSTGSLGHALPYALGVAHAKALDKDEGQVAVVLSDGECDEGSNWEAALLAGHLEQGNLLAVIDRNRLQSFSDTEETVRLEPLADKWRAFGWEVSTVDGHDHRSLEYAMRMPISIGKPRLVIAETIKGKGVSFMERNNVWHYRPPSADELSDALKELDTK
jgi:transketolase